jgi:hypothetical protein
MPEAVSTLIGAGNDAFVNLYDVIIKLPDEIVSATISGVTDPNFQNEQAATRILTRIGNFQPPESALGEYRTYYQSASLDRQNAKIALTRTITLPFRIDGDSQLYRVLKAWQGLYLGPNQADYRLPKPVEEPQFFGAIEVRGYSSDVSTVDFPVVGSLTTKASWVFEKVMCLDVTEPQFGRDAANPIEVSATFLYYYLTPPSYPANSTPTVIVMNK